MPIYVFRCVDCGHELERFVRSAGAVNPPACPHCGSETERRFAAFATRGGESIADCAPTGGG